MKTIKFDQHGTMTVTNTVQVEGEDGAMIDQSTHREIQPHQLAAHLVMFEADMSTDELAQAHAIIAAQVAQ